MTNHDICFKKLEQLTIGEKAISRATLPFQDIKPQAAFFNTPSPATIPIPNP
jgi:hypothetical protein